VSWAFARIGVYRPSLRLPYLVYSIRCYLPLDFNRVASLRPTYRHPSLSHFLGEFPGLGLALIPDVVVSEAEPRFSPEVTHWIVGARLIGWRPVLAESPLRRRVSAGFNEVGGATCQPSAPWYREAAVGPRLLIRRETPAYLAANLYI